MGIEAGRKFFVFGASGHGKVVIDAIIVSGHSVCVVIDDDSGKIGSSFEGLPVAGIGELERVGGVDFGVIAIGDNALRRQIVGRLSSISIAFGTVVHPRACVADSASLGAGSQVLAGAVINSSAKVGEHVIVNTIASIDHDCSIGRFVHIAPGVRLCGGVRVGEGTLLGAGSVVLPGVRIGARVILGAGAVVTRDIPDDSCFVGNPARARKGMR